MRLFLICLAFSLTGTLFAETTRPEILDRIRDYDMRHSDLLVKIVRDAETLRYAKVRALEKMSVIYRQSKADGEIVAPRYLDGLNFGLVNKSPDVREAACTAAIVFNESAIAPKLVVNLANTLKEELNPAVIYACAHTLATYTKHAEIIVPALLSRVDRYLNDFQNSSADEKALREVCLALKGMHARKAFIPLLKVLQSRYDEDVKSAAQEAIQAIKIQ
ncbi:hypothetical protein [Turneriella parva]|jgi:hypothetical protein|uniref:HEAT repeat domain-containing protein n=1 Tax=Turneriella parva (strain ATCC BAA-1111 / DSM 21527 / NCTC 11395 / H) TaxID=869212 RepID=I4B365_TURPD|nr:hypothetical protein [Turneriella parva]AFM11722.1 hypothetical protein Turpa_1073 [Turneriella parva DSM 21527]